MIKLTPKYAEGDLLYTLDILHDVADALTAVFGSSDQELLSPPDVRSGFMHIASGLRDALAEASATAADKLADLKAAESERDGLRAELGTAEAAYSYVEAKYFATPGHEPLDLTEAAAFFRKRREGKAPDLTEPALQATGEEAALAG